MIFFSHRSQSYWLMRLKALLDIGVAVGIQICERREGIPRGSRPLTVSSRSLTSQDTPHDEEVNPLYDGRGRPSVALDFFADLALDITLFDSVALLKLFLSTCSSKLEFYQSPFRIQRQWD